MDNIQKKSKRKLLILVPIIILALIPVISFLNLQFKYASVVLDMKQTKYGSDIMKIDIRMDKNTKDASTNPMTFVDHLTFDIEILPNRLTDDEILELANMFTKILDEKIPYLVNNDNNNNKLVVEMEISPLSVQVVDGNRTYQVNYYRDISKALNEFDWTSWRYRTRP